MKHMPILAVFGLTALATAVAQRLPQRSELVSLALLLDIVPVCGVIIATAFAARSFRIVSRSPVCLLAAVYGYFAGGIVGAFGVAHTVAVTMESVERPTPFDYTFRFYSLVLLGVLLIAGGLIAVMKAEALARGHRAGWCASLSVWAAILLINLPLVPLQGFAILFSVLAAAGLFLLATSRRRFDRHSSPARIGA